MNGKKVHIITFIGNQKVSCYGSNVWLMLVLLKNFTGYKETAKAHDVGLKTYLREWQVYR